MFQTEKKAITTNLARKALNEKLESKFYALVYCHRRKGKPLITSERIKTIGRVLDNCILLKSHKIKHLIKTGLNSIKLNTYCPIFDKI